ncbi:uncharacterized protein LOC119183241 isoform X2 [Rhipicephalus microplus]|uniref:uncharacterized protein LOC119183241 isoform X2 n=1 Tax=Rhipicephalus microplus TaxID=6941 RepID=UPI003F6AA7A4
MRPITLKFFFDKEDQESAGRKAADILQFYVSWQGGQQRRPLNLPQILAQGAAEQKTKETKKNRSVVQPQNMYRRNRFLTCL